MKKNLLQIQPQYSRADLWSAFAEREGLFFETLELCMAPLLDNSEGLSAAMEWYRKTGLVKSVHGAFIDVNPASGDREAAALSRKRCAESCAQAKALGAEYIVFHSSCFPFLRGKYLENWAAVCVDFYTGLAEEYGLRVCVENSMDTDTVPLKALMDRCTSPEVGVCLDIGHANYSAVSVDRWFGELGEHIAYLHLSDNMGSFDDHLILGKGSVDWQMADALYRQLGRKLPMTLEVGGIEQIESSLAFLRNNKYFGIGD